VATFLFPFIARYRVWSVKSDSCPTLPRTRCDKPIVSLFRHNCGIIYLFMMKFE